MGRQNAAQAIDEDTRVVEDKGELVSQPEAWRRELRYLPRQRIWIFTINSPVGARRGDRRKHRPIHQPRVPPELLY